MPPIIFSNNNNNNRRLHSSREPRRFVISVFRRERRVVPVELQLLRHCSEALAVLPVVVVVEEIRPWTDFGSNWI